MSVCISSRGEFGSHNIPVGESYCEDCGVLDEEAVMEEREALRAKVARVEAALANHPKACAKHPDDDVISCGWKSAVLDVQRALDGYA